MSAKISCTGYFIFFQTLRQSGLNIFPAEDSQKYVSVQNKVGNISSSNEPQHVISNNVTF